MQRVLSASVEVNGKMIGECGRGLLLLLGVAKGDEERDAALLASKIASLRIFEDDRGKLNLSAKDVGGSALVVSNFTLYADCVHGRRPDFMAAAGYEKAKSLYEAFVEKLQVEGLPCETGEFGADMKIHMLGDGPVTILLDSGELK